MVQNVQGQFNIPSSWRPEVLVIPQKGLSLQAKMSRRFEDYSYKSVLELNYGNDQLAFVKVTGGNQSPKCTNIDVLDKAIYKTGAINYFLLNGLMGFLGRKIDEGSTQTELLLDLVNKVPCAVLKLIPTGEGCIGVDGIESRFVTAYHDVMMTATSLLKCKVEEGLYYYAFSAQTNFKGQANARFSTIYTTPNPDNIFDIPLFERSRRVIGTGLVTAVSQIAVHMQNWVNS